MPMWDDAIDRAIDEIAREMTTGEPHGDLRARVMARVDGDADRARRFQPSVWFAATAIVLVALVAYRETRPPDVRLKPDTTNAVRRPGPVGPGETTATSPPAATAAGPTGPALPRARRLVIPPSPIDALAPPPLDVAPLAIDDLDASPLDVQPLDLQSLNPVAPIAVTPLGNEGDRR